MYRQACLAVAWVVTIVSLIVIGGCSGSVSSTSEPAPGVAEPLEIPAKLETTQATMNSNESDADPASMAATVFGIVVTDSDIAIDVLSNGCTQAADFQIVYGDPVGSDIPVTLVRTRQDPCRKMPELVNIRVPLATDKTGQRRVVVTNEISEVQAIKRR